MVNVLNVVVSNYLLIDLDELKAIKNGPQIAKGIQKLLTYKNPKHTEALKWGYAVWGIPPYLLSWKFSEDNRSMLCSRGAKKRITKYLKTHDIKANFIDQTLVGTPINFDHSRTVLRPDQKEAVQELLQGTQGILIAHTSFGKTLTALEYMRRLGQRTVVVVHTTFLQEQWIKEATNPKTFNMDIKDIGGVGGVFGGKKRRMGKLNICLYHSLSDEKHLEFFRPYIGLIMSDEVQKSPIDDIQKVVNEFPARYRMGMSAKIERKDGKEFLTLDTFGEIVHITEEKESDSKILSSITIVPTGWVDLDAPEDRKMGDYTGMLTRMASDKERNTLICKIVISKIRQGKLVLIFVERKEQAGYLMKMLSNFKGDMLLGPTDPASVEQLDCPRSVKDILKNYDDSTAYERISKAAEKKELQFIIGTQKAEVGLSIRTIDVGLITTPTGNNFERFNQQKGRIERTYGAELEKFFGHKKLKPELIVLKDKTRSSRNAASALKAGYGEIVTEVKRKLESNNVIVRRRDEK